MMMNPVEAKLGILNCIVSLVRESGVSRLFKGLPLIMLRQVPYTCVKLSGYELFSGAINSGASKLNEYFPDCSLFADNAAPVTKRLVSGVCAGVSAAFISQPADVLLSRLCGGTSSLTECIIIDGLPSIIQACRDIGWRGCYAGIAPRALMVGILTALQFNVYENAKERISVFRSNFVV
jgi:solute carrier family 25 (mitochondrial phosphate transporter), member 3